MSDDEPRAGQVTGLSLRTEKFRRAVLKASGGHQADPGLNRPGLNSPGLSDPGLSKVRPPRDPELVNRPAIIGFAVGIFTLFLDPLFVPSIVTAVFCVLGLRQARALEARGKSRFGRRRALWGLGFAAWGVANVTFQLVRAHFAA